MSVCTRAVLNLLVARRYFAACSSIFCFQFAALCGILLVFLNYFLLRFLGKFNFSKFLRNLHVKPKKGNIIYVSDYLSNILPITALARTPPPHNKLFIHPICRPSAIIRTSTILFNHCRRQNIRSHYREREVKSPIRSIFTKLRQVISHCNMKI